MAEGRRNAIGALESWIDGTSQGCSPAPLTNLKPRGILFIEALRGFLRYKKRRAKLSFAESL
ncbi:hypothetical protein A2841_00915 [Candidatus Kaiserbacteria bacterium RIFCSPHIGHO2_01_FULL_48_10]|uniref:Uncharacterized protein n=1 Tax=Candidatus Kaiserbacteria bacterium RIFCSPHIGHO2_01_FULL_48_10 TaxID=1798476 RepID=A0A1F6C311_9BACT|nr:MAG: hypothetical protein A2841_00915 [Candidatus Kaiserbacteria bacterium RIFCSPHIGHO2_01_FULL_48_10]